MSPPIWSFDTMGCGLSSGGNIEETMVVSYSGYPSWRIAGRIISGCRRRQETYTIGMRVGDQRKESDPSVAYTSLVERR